MDQNFSNKKSTEQLTKLQFEVTQNCGTEPPFDNEFWNHKESGIYVDIISGEPLFSSIDKFDSGTGWPSFSRPIEPENIVEMIDHSHHMQRVEVSSRNAQSHLGHVFNDGVADASLRYCINSASLKFIPNAELARQGYDQYLHLFNLEKAILAGGCFWGMEELLRKLPGVISTKVGYIGGNIDNPTYELVKTGTTGYAEAVEVVYDTTILSYNRLLEFFFQIHDPTTLNRQGNDSGTQYRSAIFLLNSQQQQIAGQVINMINDSGKWSGKVVTELNNAGRFYPAEEYHQSYLQHYPQGYSCHFIRPNWKIT